MTKHYFGHIHFMETLRAIVSNMCSCDRKNHISQKCIIDTIRPQVFLKSIHVHLGYTMNAVEMANLKQYLNNVARPSNDNRTAIRDDVEGGEAKIDYLSPVLQTSLYVTPSVSKVKLCI